MSIDACLSLKNLERKRIHALSQHMMDGSLGPPYLDEGIALLSHRAGGPPGPSDS